MKVLVQWRKSGLVVANEHLHTLLGLVYLRTVVLLTGSSSTDLELEAEGAEA